MRMPLLLFLLASIVTNYDFNKFNVEKDGKQ